MRQVRGLGRDVAPRTLLVLRAAGLDSKRRNVFSIALPEGVRDGWTLRREGLGETKLEPERGQLRAARARSAPVVLVHVRTRELHTRTGDDLVVVEKSTRAEMVFGFQSSGGPFG